METFTVVIEVLLKFSREGNSDVWIASGERRKLIIEGKTGSVLKLRPCDH